MHPQNKLIAGYHFAELIEEFPALKSYAVHNEYGRLSLDFGNQECVFLLNQAILKKHYAIQHWNIPATNLCPTVPGRADYLHFIADLIGTDNKRILDIGTGASIIYPLLGNRIYNWSFVASEIDEVSLANASSILQKNYLNKKQIELRRQSNSENIFKGIVNETDEFDACICNPPYFESEEQALRSNKKKWNKETAVGTSNELICAGGEKEFISQMIKESVQFQKNIKLFSCLVSRKSSLEAIEKSCLENSVTNIQFIEMKTGRKVSRIAAWRFN